MSSIKAEVKVGSTVADGNKLREGREGASSDGLYSPSKVGSRRSLGACLC